MIKKLTKPSGRNIVCLLFLLLFILHKPAKAGVYYWVGGTGNWSQYNTHWATSSNGLVFHIQSPTPSDTVVFDSHSFTTTGDTVYVDSTLITCHDMIWTNVTNHPVFINQYFSQNNNFKLYGSLTLSQNMQWSYGASIYFEATSGMNAITSASQNIGSIICEGVGGSWQILDPLTATAGVSVLAGTFRTNSKNINTGTFYIKTTPTANVYLGTSTINCSDWDVESGVLYADSSNIIVYSTFSGGTNYNYRNVTAPTDGYNASNCNFNVVTLLTNSGGFFFSSSITKCNIDSIIGIQEV